MSKIFEALTMMSMANTGGSSSGGGTSGGGSGIEVSGATPGQMLLVKSVDENGKPTEWETVDRTHWAEAPVTTIVELFPSMSVRFDDESIAVLANIFDFTEGTEYEITWDGVAYKSTAKKIEMEGQTACFIGNASMAGLEDTGEPFLIMPNGNAKVMWIDLNMSGIADHTIEVKGPKTSIKFHPMEHGYLPDAYVTEYSTSDILGNEYEHIQELLSKGVPVTGEYGYGRILWMRGSAEKGIERAVKIDNNGAIYCDSVGSKHFSQFDLDGFHFCDNNYGGISFSFVFDDSGVPYVHERNNATNVLWKPNVLTSPNGTKYKLVVADDGTLSTEAVTT